MGGAVKNTFGRIGAGVLTGGLSEFAQQKPFGESLINNPLAPNTPFFRQNSLFGGSSDTGASVPGPFTLDPRLLAGDQAAITGEGQRQFDATNNFVGQDQEARAAGRQKLAEALTKQGQDVFKQGLPGIEETLNAQHLLNGSGLGQEIGRQQGNLATNIANQVGVQGAQDIDLASQQRAAALQGLQGFQTGSLQRGLSLEDQINNANISKTIGQVFAPQPPSGKQNFGTVAQGVGALAPWAKVASKAGATAAGAPPLGLV